MDLALNVLIFLVTAVITVRFFHKEGTWSLRNGRPAFRFFTVQSNIFCAVMSLLMCLVPSAAWIWTGKYIATAAVTVTMLTVFFFLGPTQGYKRMLAREDFFLHLLTPLMAIVSFVFLEKRGMRFGTSMLGMLPVLLYGVLYLQKVIRAPEGKRWEDFYGFNKDGKWARAFAIMLAGCFLVCLFFLWLQNL